MTRFLLSLLCLWFVLTAKLSAAETFTLGTATKGGGFELFGRTVSEVVNTGDGNLKLNPIATKGSQENLKLLQESKVDAGLVEGNAAFAAFQKQKNTKDNALSVLWVMYPSPGAFVVRADTPYQTIRDLKGKRIAWGTQASGLRLLAKSVVNGLDLDTDTDFSPVILKRAGEGPALVLDGKVDALWGGGVGWPTFNKISAGPKGARFISPSSEEIKRIRKRHPHLAEMTIPANTYTGQDNPIASVGLWSLILVRQDMPEEKAYALAKALATAENALVKRLPQTAFTTVVNVAKNVSKEKLHPGVRRYLKEQELLP